jgi:hypothetical protein
MYVGDLRFDSFSMCVRARCALSDRASERGREGERRGILVLHISSSGIEEREGDEENEQRMTDRADG